MPTDLVPAFEFVTGALAPDTPYQVDIIILSLNRFQETIEAVASALKQKNIDFYVAVLDQGSDDTVRRQFVAAFSGSQKLGYFCARRNLGVAEGRNVLSSIGRGEIIVGLDNDAILNDDTMLARAYESFRADGRLGALAFKILARDGQALDRKSWGYPRKLLAIDAASFNCVTFVGAGHAIRRVTWQDAGGYDPSLFFTWEEYDFCLRAISLGWLIRYDSSVSVIHKAAEEARIGWGGQRTRFFVRNRLIIARKWNTPWIALCPRMLAYVVKGLVNRTPWPTLQGIAEAFHHDRKIIRRPASPRMQEYLRAHDLIYRGSILNRLRTEVLVRVE